MEPSEFAREVTTMRVSIVLTVIGPDRPGIVELLSTTVAAHGGNWEQSRMAQLAGQFAGILRVTVPRDHVTNLHRALDALASQGLRVVSEASAARERDESRAYRLSLVGDDREGIVRDLSRALAARSVNVEELDTYCESAPMSGQQLFHARALVHLPATLPVNDLQHALEALADDLMVDLKLMAAEPGDAERRQ
jgi:glycine cleavage system regulatory protein